MMLGTARSRRCRGVTLLEVTLAMGLLVGLTTMVYWFYASVLETRREGTLEARNLRLARVVLDRIAGEIRQASLINAGGRVGLRGEPERIWLSTLRVPTKDIMSVRRSMMDEPANPQYDMMKVEYKIARHPDVLDDDGYERALGLARIEHLIPRPDSAEMGQAFEERQGSQGVLDALEAAGVDPDLVEGDLESDEDLTDEELFGLNEDSENQSVGLGPDINFEELNAPEIKHLRFCYYDGFKWWNTWDIEGENPLPQLVMIVIGFEGHPAFGVETSERDASEFCDCMNPDEEALDCEPLAPDQLSTVVRVPQADLFFRSRVSRETQAFLEELGAGTDEDSGGGEGTEQP